MVHVRPHLGRNKPLVLKHALRLTASAAGVAGAPSAPFQLGFGGEGFSADFSDFSARVERRDDFFLERYFLTCF